MQECARVRPTLPVWRSYTVPSRGTSTAGPDLPATQYRIYSSKILHSSVLARGLQLLCLICLQRHTEFTAAKPCTVQCQQRALQLLCLICQKCCTEWEVGKACTVLLPAELQQADRRAQRNVAFDTSKGSRNLHRFVPADLQQANMSDICSRLTLTSTKKAPCDSRLWTFVFDAVQAMYLLVLWHGSEDICMLLSLHLSSTPCRPHCRAWPQICLWVQWLWWACQPEVASSSPFQSQGQIVCQDSRGVGSHVIAMQTWAEAVGAGAYWELWHSGNVYPVWVILALAFLQ